MYVCIYIWGELIEETDQNRTFLRPGDYAGIGCLLFMDELLNSGRDTEGDFVVQLFFPPVSLIVFLFATIGM